MDGFFLRILLVVLSSPLWAPAARTLWTELWIAGEPEEKPLAPDESNVPRSQGRTSTTAGSGATSAPAAGGGRRTLVWKRSRWPEAAGLRKGPRLVNDRWQTGRPTVRETAFDRRRTLGGRPRLARGRWTGGFGRRGL